MKTEMGDCKSCSDCKHFVYVEKAAHKNQCKKFKDKGKPMSCAFTRSDKGPCGCHGKAHEK
jgi:hypothetical protein